MRTEEFLKPEELTIDELFNGKYNIPIYQRPYSWGTKEVKQLLSDIDASFNLYCSQTEDIDDDELIMFTGTLFIKFDKSVKNTYNIYDIVDGQQRITTLTMLLMVLLNQLYIVDSNDDIVNDIQKYLWKKNGKEIDKNLRVLSLGNIDKDIMAELFDVLFQKKDIIKFANSKLESNINEVEKNLLNNLIEIYSYFKNFTEEDLYNYFEYLKVNVRFISITIRTNLVKLFSIFESINSKGKPLEEIDLIKSYIFQNIKESNYDEYLKKWGKLIQETNDNLTDYFTIYIRANVKYYKSEIKLEQFKTLVAGDLKEYFCTDNIGEIMLNLIDDMLQNVQYYKALKDIPTLESFTNSKKVISYFIMNNIGQYKHTKALFYKLLLLKKYNNLSTEQIEQLIEYAFKFILTFQSISSRESKVTIGVFSAVQNQLYEHTNGYNDNSDLSHNDFSDVISVFNKAIIDNSINNHGLQDDIKSSVNFKSNKNVARILLYLLEFTDSNGVTDYLKLSHVLRLGKDIHIDHILPQSPNKNDENFKYYLQDNSIILKEGQDFTDPSIEKMAASDFYEKYIHVIGNLRLEWANDNIKKSNQLIKLQEFDSTFNTSKQIQERTESLIELILKHKFLLSTDDIEVTYDKDTSGLICDINSYDKEFKYSDYNPISFNFIGDDVNLGKKNYSALLSDVLELLYKYEREELIQIAKNRFSPTNSGRIYLSNNPEDMRSTIPIGRDVYAEQNLSSNYIIMFIYALVSELGLEPKDLTVQLKKK